MTSIKVFFALCVALAEFAGFWNEPDTEFCRSEWTAGYHVGRVLKANPAGPHRAYPTVQFWKAPGGSYGPCMLSLDFKYATPPRTAAQWFSVLTLARVPGDTSWDPVTLNLDAQGNLALMHVPVHGKEVFTVLGPINVPMNAWHHIDVLVDFRVVGGSVTVFLDGAPALYAKVDGGNGFLPQAHAGLYAEGSLPFGWMGNRNLKVSELALSQTAN
jgi:hypothetical protein